MSNDHQGVKVVAKLWWMIHKDLLSESRGRQFWPALALFAVIVVLLFALQMNVPPSQKDQLVSGFIWLAIFFAGVIALDRSFRMEHDDSCIEALLLYPTSGSLIYLSKLVVNLVVITGLECVLIPLFVVLSEVRLLAHPVAMAFVLLLANLGLAAIGTLLSAITAG